MIIKLKNISLAFIIFLLILTNEERAFADLLPEDSVNENFLPYVVIMSLTIVTLWAASYFTIRWIRKKKQAEKE